MIRKAQRCGAGAIAAALAAVAFLTESAVTSEGVHGALKLCANVLVPSLFPYMVISSLIVSFGTARFLERLLTPVCRSMHLPSVSASAILLGALCGFPVGAKTACELHRDGWLTAEQTERLIAVANNTGPAFVIEVVGAHCFGSRGFGLTVYIAQIVSAVAIGIVTARVCSDSTGEEKAEHVCRLSRKKDVLSTLAEAVSSAASAILTVCAFVVFFAVVLSLLAHILEGSVAESILPYLAAFLEFTSGVELSSEMGGMTGAFLSGFAVGWSGISVFAQSKMFTAPYGLRLRLTAICKCIQGVLTGIAAAVYYRFFFTPSVSASSCLPVSDTPTGLILAEVGLLILFCLFPILFEKKSVRKAS